MNEGKYCNTCRFRDAENYCTNSKLAEEIGQSGQERTDMLIYDYSEGGGFTVGDKFGCVHHEMKQGT